MDINSPQIVPFEAHHIPGGVSLSRAENWPHTARDWRLIANISDGVAVIDNGRVAGTALCTPFGDKIAAFNMIIVADNLRGRGIGKTLMQRLIDLAGPRTARLVATEAGYPLYSKMGFAQIGAITQYQGTIFGELAVPQRAITTATLDDRDEIQALDTLKSGLDRKSLWRELFACSDIKLVREHNNIVAVSACRDFGRGKVIGPVVAADIQQAKDLMIAHMSDHRTTFIRVDTPSDSGIGAWLEQMGLQHVGGGRVMLRGKINHDDNRAIFALTSQAVG